MNDLISRQAAIDALEQLVIPEDMCVFEILSHIELVIGTLPSSQPGWISCSERLPERYDNYLITTEDGMVVFGVYDPRERQWCRYDTIKSWWLYGIKVLAWMPLPKPWEGDANDT